MHVRTRLTGQGLPACLCVLIGASACLGAFDSPLTIVDSAELAQLAESHSFLIASRAQEVRSRLYPGADDVIHVGAGRAVSTRVSIKVRSLGVLNDDAFTNIIRSVDGVIVPTFTATPINQSRAHALGMDRMFMVLVPRGTDLGLLIARLSALRSHVEWAEYDAIGQLDMLETTEPFFNLQWAHENTGQTIQNVTGIVDADMDTTEAWAVLPPLQPVTIAMLDSGVSQSHREFAGLIIGGRNFLTPGDPNLWDDDTQYSHGTQTAGIVAALGDNGLGIAGMAPNARLLVGKIANGSVAPSMYTAAAALDWAVSNGARVVSMSLSFTTWSPNSLRAFQTSVDNALASGVIIVGSTGNSPGTAIGPPAAWPGVIAVGACDNRGEAFVGQTEGPEMDVSAPGVDIFTTFDTLTNPNGFAYATGTSMAVPHVSGLAAIIWGINPSLPASSVRAIIESTVDDLGTPGRDNRFGYGRINAYKAVLAARDTLYCTADVDLSGLGSVQDLFAFLEFYFAGDLRADYDRNGVVSVNDVFTFLQGWFAGCP